jgi:hypothetical protein|tara:strand:+ start:286 stop:642 length:357 start_codon:yes stop_codon:yes gene_type:complete
MSKLSNVKVASFDTGVMTSAGDYPSGGSGVYLPAGALVLRAHLSELTALASGTNVRLVAGSTNLMNVLATADIEDYNALTLTANKLSAGGELKLTTTGTYASGSRAVLHVEYVTEADE